MHGVFTAELEDVRAYVVESLLSNYIQIAFDACRSCQSGMWIRHTYPRRPSPTPTHACAAACTAKPMHVILVEVTCVWILYIYMRSQAAPSASHLPAGMQYIQYT